MKTFHILIALLLGSHLLCQAAPPAAQEEKILEPYAAKPTAEPPKGWKIQLLKNSKVENKTEIAPGKEINISVEAYKLEPIAIGNETILVLGDPFYNPLLKNAQEKTLGAAITKFSEESQGLQKNLQLVISALEKSLGESHNGLEGSEAKPSPTPEAKPTPAKKK